MPVQAQPIREKLYFWLLLLIAILIPTVEAFAIKLASMSVILLTIWWLASGDYVHKFKRFRSNKLLWLFTALFLVNLLSLFRTDHFDDATNLITRKLSLLLLPLIIATSPRLAKKQVNYLLIAFIGSLLVISLFTFREGLHPVLDRVDLTNLVRLVYLHRPYFGLFCAFAIVGLVYLVKYYASAAIRVVLILGVAYFLFFIYILYAKMTVVAFFALLVILVGVALAKKLNVYISLAIGLCLLFAMFLVIRTNETARTSIKKITNFEDFSYQEYNIHLVSSINIRYINWGCSVKILKEDHNWLAGVGIGNAQEKLNLCYKGLNPWIYEQEQNAHNEYLEEWLRNGIVGLALLLLSIGIPVGLSLYQDNYLYFSFLILFALCSVTEDMLSRQGGIMFFAFFNSLFAFNTLQREENRNKGQKQVQIVAS